MLKRKKAIGKCINLMAKGRIFRETRISMKGGRRGNHFISETATIFPFCNSSQTGA
jgi:hypothetical protein